MKNITKNLIFYTLIALVFSLFSVIPAQASTGSNTICFHKLSSGDYSYRCNSDSSNNSQTTIHTTTVITQPVYTGVAVTNVATLISTNSVSLNGAYYSENYANTTAWFEYGQSVALGQTTEIQNLSNTKIFSKALTSLTPDTIYYFRAVVKDQLGIKKGDILILKTNTVVADVSNSNTVVPNTTTVPTSSTKAITSNIITLKIENKFENISRDESVDYVVSYKNISNQKVDGLIFSVSLPKDISFEKSDKGNYSDSDHTIILQIDSLKAGEEGVLKFTGKVDSNASGKESLVTSVIGVYLNPISKIKENVKAFTLNKIKDGNSLAAASIFGNSSFLPDSLASWLLLVALIFCLIYFGRMFSKSKEGHGHETTEGLGHLEVVPATILAFEDSKDAQEIALLKEQKKKILENSFGLSDLTAFEKEITHLEEEINKE